MNISWIELVVTGKNEIEFRVHFFLVLNRAFYN